MVWQSPGFSFAAVAALALGIGANTAIFSVVNSVLLKPVPFPDPDRLVMFMTAGPDGSFPGGSPAKFQHWREQTSVVQQVAAFNTGIANLTGTGFPEQLRSARVSADYFRLFGANVLRGRTFVAEEDLPNAESVVVLSYGLWTRLFAQDPEIIGKTISLSSSPHVVIGILEASFEHEEFGQPPEVYIPFQLDPRTSDQGHYFRVAGRLVPGVTLERAQARLKVSAEDYR